ncbi:MAG TPA: isoaspartyl peptidase/L-asparaginase [Candidatus Polarisedimenticolaceae bacterium]|nr:isoaspartyl peptidase/L-asparaginase [Candidatus Polarisedimenticolaceae bacterium]
MSFALAIHGGAWNIPDEQVDAHRAGLRAPLACGRDALRRGASALDVVELVVRMLEDDPAFNAGRGSHLNSAGRLEMDASIMEGTRRRAGAVAAIAGVRHPVSVARRVMEASPHVLLVGDGARRFARREGAEMCTTRSLLVGRELARWERIRAGERALVATEFSPGARPHGTVGAVAVDRKGRCAAATSTGGTQDKAPGRVGDSPIVGAGTYADDRRGAASCTGWGEAILRAVLAKTSVDALAGARAPSAAGRLAIAELARLDGHGGVVLVDRRGRAGFAFNTPRMARGWADARRIVVLVERREPRR